MGYFIDECSCTAGTASIHPHVRRGKLAGLFVMVKEHNFCILSAQFHRNAGTGKKLFYRQCIRYNLLDVETVYKVCQRSSPASADSKPEKGSGEPIKDFSQYGCRGI